MAEAKKRGPLFWVILSVGALVALLAVVLAGVGYFAVKRATPTVSTANPAYAALKLLTSSSPDLEIIKEQPEQMQILVHDKKTGEYFLNRADDATKSIIRIPVPADQLPPDVKK